MYTGVVHSPYKTAHNIRNAPYKTENPRFKGPFQTVFVYPSCSRPTPGHISVHFPSYTRAYFTHWYQGKMEVLQCLMWLF